MSPDDWRLDSPGSALAGRTFRWAGWEPYRAGWDHDHCELCWARIWGRVDATVDEVQHASGWVTSDDDHHWDFGVCFADLD